MRRVVFMMSDKRKSLLYLLLILLVLTAGVWIRVAHFPNIPPGLNQDEAGSAYESWSLAETGKDKWGNVLPAYFPSWGSGQNVLLAYLTIPALKLLGLNIFSARIVSLIFGLLMLPLMLFALWPAGRAKALLGLLVVALVPWHFMLSRWALESNLLPFFMLLGCALMIRGAISGKKRWIIPSLLPLAFALYAYGTTMVVLPLFLLLFLTLNFKRIWLHKWSWLVAFGIFCIAGFPFFIYFFEHYIIARNIAWTDHFFFSTPMCPSTRLSQVGGSDLLSQNGVFMSNGFNDGSNYNLIQGYNLLYPFCSLLGGAGLVLAVVKLLQSKRVKEAPTPVLVAISVFTSWGISACVLFFLFELNVNRFNHFYVPCIVLGIWLIDLLVGKILQESRKMIAYGIVFTMVILCTLPAIRNYFTNYPDSSIKTDFNSGLDEAFEAVKKLSATQILITDKMQLPYVYALFYLKYPPAQFQQEVNFEVKDGIYKVNRFGRYIFYPDYLEKTKQWGFLARKDELHSNDQLEKKLVFQNDFWEVGVMKAR